MDEVELDVMSNCAKALLKDIMDNNMSKSQLKVKFSSEYPENIIDMALKFLEDEKCIESKTVENLEYYSRITGYYQKVSGWNQGKLQEFNDRRRYST
jgi:hypothetical protein